MPIVTRVEIADQVEDLFDGTSVDHADVLLYATEHGARKEVLTTLGRLHGDAYRALPDLWSELNDIPIEV